MEQKDKELKIKSIVDGLNEKGKNIPINLSQIEELPYSDFSSLLSDVKAGRTRVLRFSIAMESSLLSIITSTSDKIKSNIGLLIMYGGILAALFFSYVYSWWLLLTIPFAFGIGASITKKAYNSAVFKSAFSSELIFCFLYFTRQISVEIPESNEHYYYKGE